MTEGVGITRLVEMYHHIQQDKCFTIDDQKLTWLAMYLREKEGIVMGMSAMLNLAGAFNMALKDGPGQRVVTFLCDGGERAISKMYNPEFLLEKKLDGSILSENEIKEIYQKL